MSWSINWFHIGATAGVGIASIALLFLIRDPKTPKWLDVFVVMVLVFLAALFLGMIQTIFNMLPDSTTNQRDLRSEYQVALYVIPFFTAGLATNLLSSIISNQRNYNDTMPLKEALKRTAWTI